MATQQDFLKVLFSYNEADLLKFVNLLKESDNAAEELEKQMKKAGASTDDATARMAKGFDSIVTGVKAFIGLQVVQELQRVAVEASKIAAAGEGVRSAFANLGGTQADLRRLSDAIGGTVNNLKLMEFAVKAMQKGLNMDQITKTLVFLDKQANATGGSFEVLADKAIKGMKDIPAFMSDVEKKTKDLGDTASKTGDAFGKIATSQDNLKEAFGRLINSAGWQEVTNFLADQANKSADAINMAFDPIVSAQIKIFDLLKEAEQRREGLTSGSTAVREKSKERLAVIKEELDIQQALLAEAEKKQAAMVKQAEANRLANAKKAKEEELAELAKLEAEKAIEENKKRLEEQKKYHAELIQQFKDALQKRKEALDEFNKTAGLDRTGVGAEGMKELLGVVDKQITGEVAEDVAKSVAAIEPEPIDPSVQKLVSDLKVLPKTSDEAKKNFEAAALSVFSLVDSLTSLGDEGSTPGKKFFAVLQGMLGLISLIPGVGTGVAIASGGLGLISNLVNRNEGGWIPGSGLDRDSILLHATPGEFVTRRSSAMRSPLLLDAINSGELDDKIFKQFINAPVVNLNQEQVVAAIERMPQVDLYKSGSALYETRKAAGERNANRKRRLMP